MSIVDTIRRSTGKLLPTKYKMPIRGHRVLVTGAGSGIGRLMAIECADRGAAKVIIWDMSEERAAETAATINAAGGVAEYQVVDVTDQEAVEAAAEIAGDVDILFNNAGVVSGRDFLDNTQESVDRTLDVNVRSLYIVTRPFLKGMVERDRGTVVVTASAAGVVGVAKQTDYSASKWAAIGFTESLRVEMKRRRHRVNTLSLCPFYVDTGMFDGVKTKVPWIFPILRQEDVARTFVDAVEAGRHQVLLPWTVRLVHIGRLLPLPLFDAFCGLLGVNATMEEFRGRPGDRV